MLKILLVYCNDLYRHNFSSLYPSVNTDRNIISVYTKGMTKGYYSGIQKDKSYGDVTFLLIE